MDDITISQESIQHYQEDEKTAIDIQIATAKAYPRNVKDCIEEATEIACMDEETARSCRYAIPRAGKAITGPSVVAAKIAAQSWGNMRINSTVKQITNTHVICEAVAFDLQKNIAMKAEIRKSILGKYGRYTNDMITITGNAGSSVALRNAIFSVIPKNVIISIMKATKNLITHDLDTQEKVLIKANQVFEYYEKTYKTTQPEFLKLINRSSFGEISKDDIVVLYDFFESLRAGDSTPEEIFGRRKETGDNKKKNLRDKKNNITPEMP